MGKKQPELVEIRVKVSKKHAKAIERFAKREKLSKDAVVDCILAEALESEDHLYGLFDEEKERLRLEGEAAR